MRDDCSSVRLGMPELRVVDQKELEDRFEARVMYRREWATCPCCGGRTWKEHDRRMQRKHDRRLRDKPVFLMLVKRRFRCCLCGNVFTEPDGLFGPRRRSSFRFREYLGQEALHQTVRRTAQKERVGEGLVRRCVAEEIGRRLEAKGEKETPEFIGLDEYTVRGRLLYHPAICNLVDGEVMEVVEGEGATEREGLSGPAITV